MSIQSTVNQGISLLGFMMGQTPMAAAQREKAAETERTLKAQKRYDKLHEQALASNAGYNEPGSRGSEVELAAWEETANAARDLFMANPTDETYQTWMDEATGASEFRADIEASHRKEADERAAERAELVASRTIRAEERAREALAEEQNRLAASNEITRSLDISNIDERALPRLERAYKRAVRDTRYLAKGEKSED